MLSTAPHFGPMIAQTSNIVVWMKLQELSLLNGLRTTEPVSCAYNKFSYRPTKRMLVVLKNRNKFCACITTLPYYLAQGHTHCSRVDGLSHDGAVMVLFNSDSSILAAHTSRPGKESIGLLNINILRCPSYDNFILLQVENFLVDSSSRLEIFSVHDSMNIRTP